MEIPYKALAASTLSAIIEEFVTRDGTDHSVVELRIASVMKQLEAGVLSIHYDGESCNITSASKRS